MCNAETNKSLTQDRRFLESAVLAFHRIDAVLEVAALGELENHDEFVTARAVEFLDLDDMGMPHGLE